MKQAVLTPPRQLGYKFSNWTGKTIAQHILKNFHKSITSRGTIYLLHRLNLKLLCPRPKPAKADEKKQIEFKTTFDQTIQTLTPQDHMLFFDAATIQHSATQTRVWGEKAHQPILPVVGGRKKMHIIGAIEPTGDKGWFAECPTLGAKELIAFLKGLLTQYPTGKIYVVLDNARAHHAKRVTEFVLKNERLHLLFLPPYSPDFNPIEDFWRLLRKEVTHNTYFPTFDEFRTTIVEFLTQFKYPTGIIASISKKYKLMIESKAIKVMV